jgi:hypothetical protein
VALCKKKSEKLWLWRAYDPIARRTIAWVLGRRDDVPISPTPNCGRFRASGGIGPARRRATRPTSRSCAPPSVDGCPHERPEISGWLPHAIDYVKSLPPPSPPEAVGLNDLANAPRALPPGERNNVRRANSVRVARCRSPGTPGTASFAATIAALAWRPESRELLTPRTWSGRMTLGWHSCRGHSCGEG